MASGRANTVGRMLSLCSSPHLTSLTYLDGRLVNLTKCEMIGWTGSVERSIRCCQRSCDSRTYISEGHSVSLRRFRHFATHCEMLKAKVVSIVGEGLCIELTPITTNLCISSFTKWFLSSNWLGRSLPFYCTKDWKCWTSREFRWTIQQSFPCQKREGQRRDSDLHERPPCSF